MKGVYGFVGCHDGGGGDAMYVLVCDGSFPIHGISGHLMPWDLHVISGRGSPDDRGLRTR